MQCLPEEAGDPGGVDAGEAGGGLDGGVAADDAGAVFVDVEADVETVHLPSFGYENSMSLSGPSTW